MQEIYGGLFNLLRGNNPLIGSWNGEVGEGQQINIGSDGEFSFTSGEDVVDRGDIWINLADKTIDLRTERRGHVLRYTPGGHLDVVDPDSGDLKWYLTSNVHLDK